MGCFLLCCNTQHAEKQKKNNNDDNNNNTDTNTDCSIDIESDDDYDADADDNGNIIAYAYFIKLSFVVKVCEKLYIKIDWNVLLPLLSVTSRNANYCYVCAPFYFMFYTLLPFLPYIYMCKCIYVVFFAFDFEMFHNSIY